MFEFEAEGTAEMYHLFLPEIRRSCRTAVAPSAPGALCNTELKKRRRTEEAVKSPERAEKGAPQPCGDDGKAEEKGEKNNTRTGQREYPHDPYMRMKELENRRGKKNCDEKRAENEKRRRICQKPPFFEEAFF